MFKIFKSPENLVEYVGYRRLGIINSHSLHQVEVGDSRHNEEQGWKAKPKQEMLSSRTAFLVVSVLFQVAKCSLGKLWLCIIEIQ